MTDWGVSVSDIRGVGLDMARMQARRASIVRQSNDGIAFLFRKNKVTFFNGTATFAGVPRRGIPDRCDG